MKNFSFLLFITGFLSGIFFLDACTEKKSQSITFELHELDSVPPFNPWIKIPADINGDGYHDIVIGGQKGPLVWYKSPSWEKYPIANGGYNTVDGEACDIDMDGDLDLVLGGLVWFENPGSESSESGGNWILHRIADHETHDVEIADINKDGLWDVITRDQSAFSNPSGNTIHVWYQINDTLWQEQVINCPHGEGIKVFDLDGDQDTDIIIGGIWYENTGNKDTVAWSEHVFTEWHPDASIEIADINRDGRHDIVLAPAELAKQYYRLSWFQAPSDIKDGKWSEHVVVDSIECVIHSLKVADMNMDGLPDILYAEMHQGADPDEVVLMLNIQKGKEWDKLVLGTRGSHVLQVLDYDNDGDLDFFGANWSGKYQPLQLWENKLK